MPVQRCYTLVPGEAAPHTRNRTSVVLLFDRSMMRRGAMGLLEARFVHRLAHGHLYQSDGTLMRYTDEGRRDPGASWFVFQRAGIHARFQSSSVPSPDLSPAFPLR